MRLVVLNWAGAAERKTTYHWHPGEKNHSFDLFSNFFNLSHNLCYFIHDAFAHWTKIEDSCTFFMTILNQKLRFFDDFFD